MTKFINKIIAKRYLCIEKIGAGGMGMVYLAQDTLLQRKVVLKLLLPTLEAEKARSRFLREAKLLSQLNHPHIVTIHDFGIWNEIMYITLEYLEGKNLQQIIEEEGALPTPWIMNALSQIMEALEAIHQAGTIHRDLKPSNIFCLSQPDSTDHIKILDFGTAISLDQDFYKKITTSGEVIGTPHYMSPEQILGKEDISQRADIYSLGIILYEMLAGTPPFYGDNSISILLAHLYKSPGPIDERTSKDDPQRQKLLEVMTVCLNKNPGDRYGSIQELRLALAGAPKGTARVPENLADERSMRFKQFYQGPLKDIQAEDEKTIETHRQDMEILIIEAEDLPIERSLTPMLRIAQYLVSNFNSLDRHTLQDMNPPDLIILNKGKEDNFRLIQEIRENQRWDRSPIFISGPEADLDYISQAIETGASDYLSHPFDPKEIIKKIERVPKFDKNQKWV